MELLLYVPGLTWTRNFEANIGALGSVWLIDRVTVGTLCTSRLASCLLFSQDQANDIRWREKSFVGYPLNYSVLRCFAFCVSLSLSLSHTHTHTHYVSLSLFFSHGKCFEGKHGTQMSLRVEWRKVLLRKFTILFTLPPDVDWVGFRLSETITRSLSDLRHAAGSGCSALWRPGAPKWSNNL